MPCNDSKVLFLTGAPVPSTLEWSDSDQGSEQLLPAFSDQSKADRTISSPIDVYPQWRKLQLKATHLPSGLTQATVSEEEPGFVTASEISSQGLEGELTGDRPSPVSDVAEELSQFYEHSFAIHDGTDMQGTTQSCSMVTDDETYVSSGESSFVDGAQHQATWLRLCRAEITNLKDLPGAGQLRSLLPQTVTVNLIFGIIAISKPRAIVTRKGNRLVELVEILVGDDTRAGFSVSIWLNAESRSDATGRKEDLDKDLRSQALSLRPRDIVLARFVALGTFKGRVHGQSLRRGITTLDLLYRNAVDAEDSRGALRARDLEGDSKDEASLAKVKLTKDWVSRFVGGRSGPNKMTTPMPADTQ